MSIYFPLVKLCITAFQFSNYPSSGPELCQLFCNIQAFLGLQCYSNINTTITTTDLTLTTAFTTTATTQTSSAATSSTSAPLTTTSVASTPTTAATTSSTPASCPAQYVSDPEATLLCLLWAQLLFLQQNYNSTQNNSISSGVGVVPSLFSISCPFRY
jgi:hypothetical protein